jgi:uncharacterized protein YcaQ
MLKATPEQVQRLAVRNQRLEGAIPRARPTAQDLLDTVKALRCLQLDPTAVVARNQALVLFSRHGQYDPTLLDGLAYQDRDLFEYWAHEASLVLAEDLPIHRHEMRTWPPPSDSAWRKRVGVWYESEHEFRAHILARLAEDGPLRAKDIEDRAKVGWESTGWTHARNVARMLDIMWVKGLVGISRREGAQRVWDLMERCLPPAPPDEELSAREVTRRAAPLAIRALGAARPVHIRNHFVRGRYTGLPEVLEQLRVEGTIERIAVEGLGEDWWIHSADVERLDDEFRPRTTLLSPFDNLLCDRARTEQLFGFEHRLEIYTPKPKRRWGYFVLPILHGHRLVGRADLAFDRKREALQALAVHKEPDAPRGKGLPQRIRRELERLAAWQGAKLIEVHAAPDAWKPILNAA